MKIGLLLYMKPIQLSIPEPCHENWAAMTPVDKGRFCGSCQKNVVDFTRSSDREVLAYLKENDNICGRFDNSQLERNLTLPAEKSSKWPTAAVAITLLSLTPLAAIAQAPERTERSSQIIKGKVLVPPTMTITGMVSDAEGPLAGAKVVIQNTAISVETDIEGNYAIDVSPGQTLVFSYRDFELQKNVVLHNSKIINATFLADETLGAVVVDAYRRTTRYSSTVGLVISTSQSIEELPKKRSFFGRIFHSIGDLFR